MPRFQFVAQDGGGTRRSGTLEATDRSAAARELRQRDLRPIQITAAEPDVERWAAGFRHRAFPAAPASLAQFFSQLASLIRSGVTAHEAMRELSTAIHDGRLARAAEEMAPRLSEGAALAELLARYPGLFPRHVVALVRAGEELGGLPEVLQSLADQYETEANVEARLRWVRLYYGAVLVLAVLVAPFPWMVARGMRWYLELAATRLLPGLLVLLAALVVLRGVMNLPAAEGLRVRVTAALPIVGDMARWSVVARFLQTLSLSERAGVALDRGLELGGEASGHPGLRQASVRAAEQVRHGRSLREALTGVPVLSRRVRQMLAGAERAGSLEASVDSAATMASERREAAVGSLTVGMSMGALALAGVIVAVAAAMAWRNLYAVYEVMSESGGV